MNNTGLKMHVKLLSALNYSHPWGKALAPQAPKSADIQVKCHRWMHTLLAPTSADPQTQIQNTVFDPQLAESTDVKPMDTEGRLYLLKTSM